MRFCDEVAGIAAVRHSGCRVVTAAMDRMTFIHPVNVGQLLTVQASVNAAWRSSMEVGVRVTAEDIRAGETVHVSTAYLTMVALDEERRPRRSRRWRRSRPTSSAGPARPSSAATTGWRSAPASKRSAARPAQPVATVARSARSCSWAER